MMWDRGLGMM
nr:Chain C, MET-MET-TRP-ASP-ARG-GLY-LEU-GLY-MET-MET [synthetic construct]6AMT_F Chain F, MET-MET-TRP-ASP-ARG-GLY-LEU-GLY-MET-MET [synthetic construct]6AMU_C Chain C, MET-MET-TRP-ASP-ARG-GLY-LEU-GLY-MET-MET [synthetic construct]